MILSWIRGCFLITLALTLLMSCNSETPIKKEQVKQKNIPKESILFLNNPAIFMGSTFGEFIQVLHKTGKYNEMLIYTSETTKQNFSNKQLLDFYQNMQFSYPLKLKAIENNILLYKTTINATEKTIQFNVVIENDTCRVLFEKLNPQNPFIGM
jgi:hypothetical protein